MLWDNFTGIYLLKDVIAIDFSNELDNEVIDELALLSIKSHTTEPARNMLSFVLLLVCLCLPGR